MRLAALIVLSLFCTAGVSQDGSKSYVLKPDDDLLSIAEQLRPKQATINQMGLALLRANQKAISERTTYRLPPGTRINVPDEKTVMSVDAQTALIEFGKLWRAEQHYRAGLSLERSGNMFHAFVSYVEAAKLGHGRAALRLGQLYDSDFSGFVRHDLLESARWYETARKRQVDVPKQRSRI